MVAGSKKRRLRVERKREAAALDIVTSVAELLLGATAADADALPGDADILPALLAASLSYYDRWALRCRHAGHRARRCPLHTAVRALVVAACRITMFRAYRAASSMLASGAFDTPLLLEHVKRLRAVK